MSRHYCYILLDNIHTFTIPAFPCPQTAKAQYSALFTTGKVNVIRDGGGLGESFIGATHTDVSSKRR